MAALAHACDDDPALDHGQQIHRPAKLARIEAGREGVEPFGFQAQDALCHCEISGGVAD